MVCVPASQHTALPCRRKHENCVWEVQTFSILFSDILSIAMQNRPKNICNAESFSEISAKTIDYKVGDAYTIALLTKAVTPLQQVYSRHRR